MELEYERISWKRKVQIDRQKGRQAEKQTNIIMGKAKRKTDK